MNNFPIFNDFSPHLFPQEPLNWTKFFFSIKKKKKLNGCASRGLADFPEPVIMYSGPYIVIYLYTHFTETGCVHPPLSGVVPVLGGNTQETSIYHRSLMTGLSCV